MRSFGLKGAGLKWFIVAISIAAVAQLWVSLDDRSVVELHGVPSEPGLVPDTPDAMTFPKPRSDDFDIRGVNELNDGRSSPVELTIDWAKDRVNHSSAKDQEALNSYLTLRTVEARRSFLSWCADQKWCTSASTVFRVAIESCYEVKDGVIALEIASNICNSDEELVDLYDYSYRRGRESVILIALSQQRRNPKQELRKFIEERIFLLCSQELRDCMVSYVAAFADTSAVDFLSRVADEKDFSVQSRVRAVVELSSIPAAISRQEIERLSKSSCQDVSATANKLLQYK